MHSNDNGRTTLDEALIKLDGINAHVVFLTSVGMTQEATGAANAWLDGAIRAAMMPAQTHEAAEFKIKLLAGNMHGWAIQTSKANGLIGAIGLIMGALSAEAREWGIKVPGSWEDFGVEKLASGCAAAFDPGVVASYRNHAKPRRLGPAIRRYEKLVAEIDAMLARGEEGRLLADALYRSREALLDAMAVSTRDVVELERKQRAFVDFRELRDPGSWLLENGMSVAFKVDYHQLELPPAEVARLKGMFPNVWKSDTRPDEGAWAGVRSADATH